MASGPSLSLLELSYSAPSDRVGVGSDLSVVDVVVLVHCVLLDCGDVVETPYTAIFLTAISSLTTTF